MMPLNLFLPSGAYVGGQTFHGIAELHTPQVKSDKLNKVYVKFEGLISTNICHRAGVSRVQRDEKLQVVSENRLLWKNSSKHRPPVDGRIIRIPFEFTVPCNAPPSYEYHHSGKRGSIVYSVELVGVRSGMFSGNRRVRKMLSVIAPDTGAPDTLWRLRDLGFPYSFGTKVVQKKIQFEGYKEPIDFKMEFHFPEVPSYPVSAPVPHTIYVVAVTGITSREGGVADDGLPLFHPPHVQLRLRRHVWIKAQWLTASDDETVTTPSGLGTDPSRCLGVKNHLAEVQARQESREVDPGRDDSFYSRSWVPTHVPDRNFGG